MHHHIWHLKKIFKKSIFICVSVCGSVNACHVYVVGTCGGALGAECHVYVVGTCEGALAAQLPTQVVGTEPGSSGKAAGIL